MGWKDKQAREKGTRGEGSGRNFHYYHSGSGSGVVVVLSPRRQSSENGPTADHLCCPPSLWWQSVPGPVARPDLQREVVTVGAPTFMEVAWCQSSSLNVCTVPLTFFLLNHKRPCLSSFVPFMSPSPSLKSPLLSCWRKGKEEGWGGANGPVGRETVR